MEDSSLPFEAVGLPVQGPHRHPGRGGDAPPLRLILQPGGLFIDLVRPDLVLGRHSDADVRLPLPDVSRRHCRFNYRDGAWWIVDLNSLNGVHVNEERVHQCQLRDGDAVRVGGFSFRVEFPSTPTPDHQAATQNVLRSIAEALPEPAQRRAS